MSFFSRFSRKSGKSDDALYAQVWREIESKNVDEGLWARLWAENKGDEDKTKAAYLKERVSQLLDAEVDVRTSGNKTQIEWNRSFLKRLWRVDEIRASFYVLAPFYMLPVILWNASGAVVLKAIYGAAVAAIIVVTIIVVDRWRVLRKRTKTEVNSGNQGAGVKKSIYAGFWIRGLAFVIDGFIISVFLLVPIQSFISDAMAQFAPIPVVYWILFWIWKGATPGKMLVRIKIVKADTLSQPSVGALVGRSISYYVSAIPFYLGYLWILAEEDKRGFHDKLSGTAVIYPARVELGARETLEE